MPVIYAGTVTPPAKHAVIKQREKQFDPPLTIVVKGTTIDFPNEDKIFHNVFSVSRQAEMIVVTARARSFLHSQVRSMVGSLKLVGEGKWSPRDFRAALDAADRARCGPLAPPDGLYLTGVSY